MVSLAIGIAVSVAAVPFVPLMLRLVSTPADVIGPAGTYLRIYFMGVIFLFTYNMGGWIVCALLHWLYYHYKDRRRGARVMKIGEAPVFRFSSGIMSGAWAWYGNRFIYGRRPGCATAGFLPGGGKASRSESLSPLFSAGRTGCRSGSTCSRTPSPG